MKGNNSLILNHAEMAEAVQHYFVTRVFQSGKCPKVGSIKHLPNVCAFEVHLDGPLQEPQAIRSPLVIDGGVVRMAAGCYTESPHNPET